MFTLARHFWKKSLKYYKINFIKLITYRRINMDDDGEDA